MSGLEFTIHLWVSIRKTCLRISISAAISRFPARRPKFKVVHVPDNPYPAKKIGFPSPFLGVPDIRKPSNFKPCMYKSHDYMYCQRNAAGKSRLLFEHVKTMSMQKRFPCLRKSADIRLQFVNYFCKKAFGEYLCN